MKNKLSKLSKVFAIVNIVALFVTLWATNVFPGQELVNLRLTGDLTDTKGNLTSGTLERDSDATYVNTAGALAYSRGTRINYLLYSEDTSNAAWIGGTVQTVAVTLGTYSLAVYKTGATLTAAATTAAITPLAGLVASVGTPIYFTVTTAGDITITTDSANPKGSLEKLPSGNVIGSDLMDQEALGSELVTNGSFTGAVAGAYDNDPTSWSVSSEDANGYVTGTGTATTFVRVNSVVYLYQNIAWTENKIYKVTFDVSGVSGSPTTSIFTDGLISSAGKIATVALSNTSYLYYFKAVSLSNQIVFTIETNSASFTIDNVSVKEVTSPAKGAFHGTAMLAGSTELITNGGFETGTFTSPADFGTWTETRGGTDTIEDTTAYLGSHAAVLTNVDSGVTFVDQDITTTANKLYKLEFYTKSTTTTAGRYNVYNNSTPGDIVATTATGVTGTTYTKVTKYFYTPTSCVSVKISLYAPASAGDAWFDYVSVRQVQTAWIRYGTNTMEIDSAEGSGGALKFTGDGSASAGGYLYLNSSSISDASSNLIVSETYQVTFKAQVSSSGSVTIQVNNNSDNPSVTVTDTSLASKTLYFKATSTTNSYIKIGTTDLASGESVWIDDLTIKSVPDLAYLSPGTYKATSGSTATIPAEPRFETNGLLVEGEATNLLTYSYDFSQWTNSSTSETANVTDPFGTANSAYTITNTGADGYITLATTSLNAAYHTASFYVYPGTSDDFTIMLYDTTGSATKAEIDFSVTAGVIAVVASDTGSGGVRALGATGWYRCWATTAAAVTAGNVHAVRFYPGRRGATTGTETTVIGLSQLEATAYPTSYIPTNGCPVTRLTEAGGSSNGYYWTMSAALKAAATDSGTMLVDFIPGHAAAGGTGTESGIVSLTNSATSFLYYDYTNTNFEATDGTNTADNDETIANGTTYTVAIRWDQDANSGDGYLKVSEKHSGTWTHGTATAFNDAYAAGDYLRLGYTNEYPFWIKNIRFFDGWVKDDNLNSPSKSGIFPILPIFKKVRPYQY